MIARPSPWRLSLDGDPPSPRPSARRRWRCTSIAAGTYIGKLEAEGVIHRAPVGCGEQLIGRLRDEAASLALFFLNEPEGKMLAALERTRNNLEAEIATILGAELAAAIAEAFVGAVAGHRRELESMTGKSGQAS